MSHMNYCRRNWRMTLSPQEKKCWRCDSFRHLGVVMMSLQVNKALVVLHSRQLLASVLAQWQGSDCPLNCRVLGGISIMQLFCLLDLLVRCQASGTADKVGVVTYTIIHSMTCNPSPCRFCSHWLVVGSSLNFYTCPWQQHSVWGKSVWAQSVVSLNTLSHLMMLLRIMWPYLMPQALLWPLTPSECITRHLRHLQAFRLSTVGKLHYFLLVWRFLNTISVHKSLLLLL